MLGEAEARAAAPSVDVRHLIRRFGDVAAVDGITMAIPPATIFGLIGPNGAGKTTLIRMLTTLLPPSSGSAAVAARDVVAAPADVRRRIGYVPQLLSVDGALTGYQNMLLSARLYAIRRGEQRARVAEMLALFGLRDAADRVVREYSGGMIRRLEIAQALLHRPAVLFLDEPTVGLDPAVRKAVWDHLLDIRRRFGTTMLVTSHQLEDIDRFCDQVALIDRGRIVLAGRPAEIKSRVAPGATLEDAFLRLLGTRPAQEIEESHGEARRRRRAAREHG